MLGLMRWSSYLMWPAEVRLFLSSGPRQGLWDYRAPQILASTMEPWNEISTELCEPENNDFLPHNK
jgi:hypothetical protein